MTIINKKIIKAKNKSEFDYYVKEHTSRGWKLLSDVKEFTYGDYPFQVLAGYEYNK